MKSAYAPANIERNVKIYPNPAVTTINFEFQNFDKSYNLVIFNFIGKKVLEVKVTDQKMIVPLTDFYRGVYIYQVLDKQGNTVESGKFQVAK
jgi:Secretion system C-terminal sorting domain